MHKNGESWELTLRFGRILFDCCDMFAQWKCYFQRWGNPASKEQIINLFCMINIKFSGH